MLADYDGADVYGTDGDKIGSVDHTYVDDRGVPRYVGITMGGLFRKHRLVPVDGAQTNQDGLQVPFTKDTVANSPDASDLEGTIPADLLDSVSAYYAGTQAGGETVGARAVTEGDDGGEADQDDSSSDDNTGPSLSQRVSGAVQGIKNAVTDESDGSDSTSQAASGGDSIPTVAGDSTEVRDLGDVVEVPIVEEEIVKRPVVKEVLRIHKDTTSDTQTVEGDVRKETVEVVPVGDVTVNRDDTNDDS